MGLLKQMQFNDSQLQHSDILLTLSIYLEKNGKQNKWVEHLIQKCLENID